MSGPSQAICSDCRGAFYYDAAFYAERELAAPRRCRSCRAQRKARRAPRRGIVFRIGERFALLRAERSMDIYFAPYMTADSGLRAGDPVTFKVDPEEVPRPGRQPRAFDVEPT